VKLDHGPFDEAVEPGVLDAERRSDATLGAIRRDDVLGGHLELLSRSGILQSQHRVLRGVSDVDGLDAAHDLRSRKGCQVFEQDRLQMILRHAGREHGADHGALCW
jgi:hypothetical protein